MKRQQRLSKPSTNTIQQAAHPPISSSRALPASGCRDIEPKATSTSLFDLHSVPIFPACATSPFPDGIQVQEEQEGHLARQFSSRLPRRQHIPGQGIFSDQGNYTSLPPDLKAGIERLSGLPMDDVQVHYRSPEPARLRALAFTQGTEIHIGPQQEHHLPQEAWHVAQQKQGRVKPTLQARGETINDDQKLEREARTMGMKALHWQVEQPSGHTAFTPRATEAPGKINSASAPIQLQDDPKEAQEEMERVLEVIKLHDKYMDSTDPEMRMFYRDRVRDIRADAMRKKLARKLRTRQVVREEEREPKKPGKEEEELGGSMISPERVQVYFQKVRAIEQNAHVSGDKALVELYNACPLLLPILARAGLFPKLKLVDDGPDGQLSPNEWEMTVRRQSKEEKEALGESQKKLYEAMFGQKQGGRFKKLSATLFHETRHVEQIWMEVQMRTQQGQDFKQISAAMHLPLDRVTRLQKVELPKGADVSHMGKIISATAEDRRKFREIREKIIQSGSLDEASEWGGILGDPAATKKVTKLEQLHKEYRAIPDEADAYIAQGIYETHYNKYFEE